MKEKKSNNIIKQITTVAGSSNLLGKSLRHGRTCFRVTQNQQAKKQGYLFTNFLSVLGGRLFLGKLTLTPWHFKVDLTVGWAYCFGQKKRLQAECHRYSQKSQVYREEIYRGKGWEDMGRTLPVNSLFNSLLFSSLHFFKMLPERSHSQQTRCYKIPFI